MFEIKKEKFITGEAKLPNGEVIKYKAYPVTLDLMKKITIAQKNNDDIAMLDVFEKYFDKCIEIEGFFAKRAKDSFKEALERSGTFIEFVTKVMNEVGKQEEVKD